MSPLWSGQIVSETVQLSEDMPSVRVAVRARGGRVPRFAHHQLGVTGLAFLALLVGWMIVAGGRVGWVPPILASIAVVIVVPLFFYPFAKTLWAAVDFLIYRSDPSYSERHGSEGGTG